MPPPDWVWICTGDFQLIRADKITPLYDSDSETGSVLTLEPNSKLTFKAPFGGYCEPFSLTEKEAGKSAKVSVMRSSGCTGGCSSVNVIELDAEGNILK